MIKFTKAEELLREVWEKLYLQNPDSIRFIDAETEQRVLKYLNRKITARTRQKELDI